MTAQPWTDDAPTAVPPPFPCSSEGCAKAATTVLVMGDQPGHVHDCDEHTALLREWCNVTWSASMPCPLGHNDMTWSDTPRGLE